VAGKWADADRCANRNACGFYLAILRICEKIGALSNFHMEKEMTMNVKMKLPAVIGVLLFPATLFAAPSPMQEGLWEINTTMKMRGMSYEMPPTKVTHCYTKEELNDNKKVVPQQKGDCKVTDMKYSGNKMTWKMVCTGKNKSKGEGEMVFKGATAYEGSMKMETQGMLMTSKYKAKRIGDCK